MKKQILNSIWSVQHPNTGQNIQQMGELLNSNNFNNASKGVVQYFLWVWVSLLQGIARTQFPTNINYASEFPTFGEIAEVNPTAVQWKGLALGEPPCWSWLTPMPGKYAFSVILGLPNYLFSIFVIGTQIIFLFFYVLFVY